jgi:hypothetical protein
MGQLSRTDAARRESDGVVSFNLDVARAIEEIARREHGLRLRHRAVLKLVEGDTSRRAEERAEQYAARLLEEHMAALFKEGDRVRSFDVVPLSLQVSEALRAGPDVQNAEGETVQHFCTLGELAIPVTHRRILEKVLTSPASSRIAPPASSGGDSRGKSAKRAKPGG